MSAYRSPSTVVRFAPAPRACPSLGSRWRQAAQTEAISIGDSAWHWTELKGTARKRCAPGAKPQRPRAARAQRLTTPTPEHLPWQA